MSDKREGFNADLEFRSLIEARYHIWSRVPQDGSRDPSANRCVIPDTNLSYLLKKSVDIESPIYAQRVSDLKLVFGESGAGILKVTEDYLGNPSEVDFCFVIADRSYFLRIDRRNGGESMRVFNSRSHDHVENMLCSDLHDASEVLRRYMLDVYFPESVDALMRGDE